MRIRNNILQEHRTAQKKGAIAKNFRRQTVPEKPKSRQKFIEEIAAKVMFHSEEIRELKIRIDKLTEKDEKED